MQTGDIVRRLGRGLARNRNGGASSSHSRGFRAGSPGIDPDEVGWSIGLDVEAVYPIADMAT